MDIPQPPEDEETRNIIDRLANFVARNGPGFEQMTKQKQQNNPRFNFLYPDGPFYNYYNYRVTTEQAILRQQAMRQQQQLQQGQFQPQHGPPQQFGQFSHGHGPPPSQPRGSFQSQFQNQAPSPGPPQGPNPFMTMPMNTPPPAPSPSGHISRFTSGPPGLRSFQPAPTQLQFPPNSPATSAQLQFPPSPRPPPAPPVPPPPTITLDSLLAQKKSLEDSISQSELNLRSQHQVLLTQQSAQVEEALRQAVASEIQTLASEVGISSKELADFDQLLIQVMETCTKDAIAAGKAWIFTHTNTRRHYDLVTSHLVRKTTEPLLNFTQRLHLIYLVNDTVHHCQRKGATDLQEALERDAIIPMFAYTKVLEESTVGNSTENLAKLDKLLHLWESKPLYIRPDAIAQLKNSQATWTAFKNLQFSRHSDIITGIAATVQKTFESFQRQHSVFVLHVAENIKGIERQIAAAQEATAAAAAAAQQAQQQLQQEEILRQIQMQELITRPPPMPPQIALEIPKLPYYELPAGLMVPLIKPSDDSYKPLDPGDIRLPAPCPPSERLIGAIEAFYGPPSHDNPRDAEGWERLGLYEYYKQKNKARKEKEDEIREGKRAKSKSPSPILSQFDREESPSGRDGNGNQGGRRRYSSVSPVKDKDSGGRDRDNRRRGARSRSRSRSPSSNSRRSRRRSRGSRSPPSPIGGNTGRRSPTPPSFGSRSGLGHEVRLDESNKGHQLLKKMGWGGSGGLGANEQGIDAPISGGHIRDRTDQYKGVGVDLKDPFELYRKSKGYAFIERMRSRGGDEGRP